MILIIVLASPDKDLIKSNESPGFPQTQTRLQAIEVIDVDDGRHK